MSERSNDTWVQALRTPGAAQEAALADLRLLILAGLRPALAGTLPATDPHFAALAEDVAQETLLAVLAHLDSFAGRSRFTTWVQKIAVRLAWTELRRRRWKDVSWETLLAARGEMAMPPERNEPGRTAEQAEVLRLLSRLLEEELTPRQRQAMLAVQVHGLPLEEIARRMGSNRNALYKLLHDARLRLKRRLATEGLTPEDLLAAFETP